MPKITIQKLELKNPAWSSATVPTDKEVELSVEADTLEGAQFIEFRIKEGKSLVDVVLSKPGEKKAKWKPLNIPGETNVKFDALLREEPSAKNGYQTVLSQVESPDCKVQGYKVAITAIDSCFVPKQEQLRLTYTIEDAGTAAKKGLLQIWGDRYPKDEPLYEEAFNPAVGATNWTTWDGKANKGYLSGKYISPEFSPYRVRVAIGPDEDSAKDPYLKGLGKACVAEKQFEILIQNVIVRLQANRPGDVDTALEPAKSLVVEPRTAKGVMAHTGRLPLKTEKELALGWAGGGEGPATPERDGIGRIRVANKRHSRIGESLSQGSSNGGDPANLGGTAKLCRVTDAYNSANDNPPGGGGQTKYQIDSALYKRPEIPLEIEARLKSRTPTEEAKKDGLFEKEAIGPAIYDLLGEDTFLECMYDNVAGPVTLYDEARTYFEKAAMKVKRGEHNAPHKSGANPVVTYWQERVKLTSDGQEEVGDTKEEFQKGQKELTVYLNGTLLKLDEDATADNSKKIKFDYAELSNKKIKLRKGLGHDKDIVWIVRVPDSGLGHTVVADWAAYPPGDNCHKHYGGERGKPPTADLVFTLRKDYSGTLAGNFTYKDLKGIDLDPDKVDLAKRERVESEAIIADGNEKGLAGIIFSPSFMAGDAYTVVATLADCPYARDIGFVEKRPVARPVVGKTGTLVVWRSLIVSHSWRMPSPPASSGLAGGVGENDPAAAGRNHPGDGRKMNFPNLNLQAEKGFNEWVILKSDGAVAGANEEAHQNVDLGVYRTYFNDRHTAGDLGFYNIPNAGAVTNEFVRWDHYRHTLPPNIPDGSVVGEPSRQAISSWRIINTATGTDSQVVGNAVDTQIDSWDTAHGIAGNDADPLAIGGAVIAISGDTPTEYLAWVKKECKKLANSFMDSLLGVDHAPTAMKILRWPRLYWGNVWYDGTPTTPQFKSLGIGGYCRGSGQAFFFSIQGQNTTFEHEMGHSLHLTHFAAASATNFCWKHHDHEYVNCLMGYNNGNYSVPLPAGSAGAPIPISTNPRQWLCPKCLIKIRGWNELVLPSNWNHPDVF